MFGKLMGGELAPVIKALMSGDKSGLVEMARPHLPDMLRAIVAGAVQAAGGDPDKDAAFVWLHHRTDGTVTVMGTVYHRTALDEPGEVIGTVDLLDHLKTMDLTNLIQ